mgnify:CR=1 FL=1
MTDGRTDVIEYQRTVFIDGETYKIMTFGPTRGLKLAARLAKFIGEPLAAMAAAAESEQKALEVLPLAVKALVNNLDEDRVIDLIKELTTCLVVNNKQINFESYFQGKLGHLMKVIGVIIEVQFSDFWSGLAGLVGDLKSGSSLPKEQ